MTISGSSKSPPSHRKPSRRKRIKPMFAIVCAAFALIVVVVGISAPGVSAIGNSGSIFGNSAVVPAVDSEPIVDVPLDDPGPGGCVPGKQYLDDLRNYPPDGMDFKGPEYSNKELEALEDPWIDFIDANPDNACVKSMAKEVGTTTEDGKFTDWMKNHAELCVVGNGGLARQNTYFDANGKIVPWHNQRYPSGELMWYKSDANNHCLMDQPLFKYVCGNWQPELVVKKVKEAKEEEKHAIARPSSDETTTTTTTTTEPASSTTEPPADTTTPATSTSVEVPEPPTATTTVDVPTTTTVPPPPSCEPGPEPTEPAGVVHELNDDGCGWHDVPTSTEPPTSTIPPTSTQPPTSTSSKPDQPLTCMLDGVEYILDETGVCKVSNPHVQAPGTNSTDVGPKAHPGVTLDPPTSTSVITDVPTQGPVDHPDDTSNNTGAEILTAPAQ